MGSASSKAAAKTAASTASRRQYPTRIPPTSHGPSPGASAPSSPSSPSTSTITPPPSSQKSAPPAGQPSAPGPTVHPRPSASETRSQAINLDASDPQFAASLRSLGPVTPASTYSATSTFNSHSHTNNRPSPLPPSSAAPSPSATGSKSDPSKTAYPQIFPDPSQNPALRVLEARERIAREAEAEYRVPGAKRAAGRKAGQEAGARFLDLGTIREILILRDGAGGKVSAAEIERRMGLRGGVVGMLGAVGEGRMGSFAGRGEDGGG